MAVAVVVVVVVVVAVVVVEEISMFSAVGFGFSLCHIMFDILIREKCLQPLLNIVSNKSVNQLPPTHLNAFTTDSCVVLLRRITHTYRLKTSIAINRKVVYILIFLTLSGIFRGLTKLKVLKREGFSISRHALAKFATRPNFV